MTKTKAIVSSYIGVIVFALPVFLGAWKLLYWQGLLYLTVALVGTTLSHILVHDDSDITVDRAEQARAGQDWDKRLLGAISLINIVTFAVAGMDSGRFRWSGPVPVWVAVAGVVLMLAGQIIFAVAKRQNAFFSSTVRIQEERGHRVCDTGLYRIVRHPGYLGMLMMMLAFPLVMESYVAFVPTVLSVGALVARTSLEDRFLAEELPGYTEYAVNTRWRLVPGIF